jgi:crossover junction endodeoxyribonuclease RuvC
LIRIVGIDPGFSGAIALLDPGTWALEVHDMPVISTTKGKTVLNYGALAELLSPPAGARSIGILERVSAMPGQGVSSMFRFGQCFGALEMGLIGHGYEFFDPTPSSWKKHFKLSSDKDVSRGLASQRFPTSASLFSRKKDDGRAEAALLTLWGVETILPKLGLAA